MFRVRALPAEAVRRILPLSGEQARIPLKSIPQALQEMRMTWAKKTSYRFASIALAIVMLVARTRPAWVLAIHRFVEVSVGIGVGLLLTAVWPEHGPPRAAK